MNSIFNPDNAFFSGCSKLFDLILLSTLWVLICLPIVTIGPATTALYYTVVKCIRRGESEPYANFFRCFRSNFKLGALSGVILSAVAALLLWTFGALGVLAAAGNQVAQVFHMSYRIFLLLGAGFAVLLFPILSRFTLKLGGLFLTTFQLCVRHLPTTVIVGLLCLQSAQLTLAYLFPLFFAPALTALIVSLFAERVLKKYTPVPEIEKVVHRFEEDDEPMLPWYLK